MFNDLVKLGHYDTITAVLQPSECNIYRKVNHHDDKKKAMNTGS